MHITGVGAWIPRLRIARATIAKATAWANPGAAAQAKGARAICNWDEDAITMAVEAGRGALRDRRTGDRTFTPGTVSLASTTLPFLDRDDAGLVAAALDVGADAATLNVTGSLRAATSALIQACQASRAALVIGSDARTAQCASSQEMTFGHGAAALCVEPGPKQAQSLARVLGHAQVSADFVDHYRMSGENFDYALEERWIRDEALSRFPVEAVTHALKAAGIRPEQVAHWVMPGNASAIKRLAQAVGLQQAAIADNLHADCGDTGAAHPLLMLARTLERAAENDIIVLAAFGQGVDALVLQVGAGPRGQSVSRALARRCEEPDYVRYLSHSGLVDVDFGMRAERDNRSAQSVAWRRRRALAAFVGGRCNQCQTVQFPMARVCVNPQCRQTDTQQEYRLANSDGRVKTFTEDWQAYSARPPYIYGNVGFAEGGNLFMEFTDLAAGELAVGDSLQFVFRIKDVDKLRKFRRYFWKASKA
jgi:3-hydroxy-3-methylglutaryl CoA synthase